MGKNKKDKGLKTQGPPAKTGPAQQAFGESQKRKFQDASAFSSQKKMKIDIVPTFSHPVKENKRNKNQPAFNNKNQQVQPKMATDPTSVSGEASDGKKKRKKKKKNKKPGANFTPIPKTQEEIKQENRAQKNKNRSQRLQAKMNNRERSAADCARALDAEKELNMKDGRIFKVHLPDPVITQEDVLKWSRGIQSVSFPRPVEPRSFLVVFKSGSIVSKEITKLSKVKFGGKPLVIDERSVVGDTKKSSESDQVDLMDPYTL